eukprot:gnl/MRDRNA2_/MRDRNA2_33981_c0_seq1.p1 gnl/MRDRNA2_/MRDRNA2_33981_c0~~gnl/MRDRNA2_/MRDRNA2_33981_c0_seq1.p1  ORF type:complete len:688 (-),score=143.58 gnl/MRDRNA2_/MRDRNA2_33981_c0_seq1:58-2121(-)
MAASPTCGGTGDMLPAERAKASFNSKDLAKLLRGQQPEMIAKFRELFKGAPFDEERDDLYLSYKERFEKRIERMCKAMELVRSNDDFARNHKVQKVPMQTMYTSANTFSLHFSMFLSFVRSQSSDEQLKKWLGPTLAGHFNGGYAQTELGHGSNVRGLETTVTYDKATEEFIVHSPTLTSMKWWPTSMYACTHSVVFGRLIVDGKELGYHGFMVQLRGPDGRCMPGVELGEIGPKLVSDQMNIGYARFTHVRIPRFNMFARNQQLLKDGTYVAAPPRLSKFKYISMMKVRATLVGGAYRRLAQASTIAIRYSCVRKQGFKDSSANNPIAAGEYVVMDYGVQQYRLFKSLSLAYMFYWSSKYIQDFLDRVQEKVEDGDESGADELPELHATLAGLKAWSTVWAHNNIEECRKACGGQGFMMSSGIAKISQTYAEAVTVEGEQVILSLQTARYLIKAAASSKNGEDLAGSVEYLKDPPMSRLNLESFQGQHKVLLALLRERARVIALKLHSSFSAAQAKGVGFDQALNSVSILAYKAASCHSMYVMARNNWAALQDYVKDSNTLAALTRVFELVALQHVYENSGDWMDQLDSKHVDLLLDRINECLTEIRPDAIALVDSFGFLDYELQNSAIGRYDGNVYEAIYEEAKRNPLNQEDVMVGWEGYAKQLDLKFLELTAKEQRQGLLDSKL